MIDSKDFLVNEFMSKPMMIMITHTIIDGERKTNTRLIKDEVSFPNHDDYDLHTKMIQAMHRRQAREVKERREFPLLRGEMGLNMTVSASGKSNKSNYLQSLIDVYMGYNQPDHRYQIVCTVDKIFFDGVEGNAIYFGVFDRVTNHEIEPPKDNFLQTVAAMNCEYLAYSNELNGYI